MSALTPALVGQIGLTILLTMAAIILHELAHGYAAWALGDDTAKRAGRLSFNPVSHIDRFGTVLLPGFLLITQLLTFHRVLFMFGWAKPVPVAAYKFRDPRRMMALVAVAGPAMNFFLAWLAALTLNLPMPDSVADAILGFITINLVLGLFNLLPLPPLDGGRVAVGLLPARLAAAWAGLERYGILLVLVLIAGPALLGQAGIAFDPLRDTLGRVLPWAVNLTLHLAFVRDA